MLSEEPILILADSNGNAWDFARKVYQKLNSNEKRKKRYLLKRVNISKFNDNEIFVKIKESVRMKTCYFIHDSSMNPQDWLVALTLINDTLMRSSAKEIINVIPYMKYSRQDRMAEPRTPISASVVASIINLNANRVITTDLHNPAIQGSFKIPFDNLKSYPVIIEHLNEKYTDFLSNAVLVSPDVGSTKRTESYAKRINLSIAIIDKRRKQAGIIEKMNIIGNVEGKNVLIVDDLIDSGGTLIKAAELLKQKGANRIMAVLTHGVLSGDCIKKINDSLLDKVILTDTIPLKPEHLNNKIEIVSLTSLYAETIFRITHGESISQMFC